MGISRLRFLRLQTKYISWNKKWRKQEKKYRWKIFLRKLMVFGPIFWWLSVFASNAQTPLSPPLKELLMNCVEFMETTGGASKTCYNPSISSIDLLLSFVPPHVIFFIIIIFIILLTSIHPEPLFGRRRRILCPPPPYLNEKSCPKLWQHLFSV